METADFEPVIGLEVHAQLSTDSKIFATSAVSASGEPNELTDPVTLGLPGALPVLNKRVVDFAIKIGIALDCMIQKRSIFARKHYLYPDLPKGYQISQYDKPICLGGHIDISVDGQAKRIKLTRIHLEEDAGKNIHLLTEESSLVDLNRAGVPLVEIVSEPDIRTAAEAGAYMRRLRQILRYLDVCDGNMEEGSLRCDANVSIRPVGAEKFGTKVEIKNLNSFRNVERAIEYEIERQKSVISQGEKVMQETRLWDDNAQLTRSMRSKELAEDYRYFPDPDLPPLIVEDEWVANIRDSLPELPQATFERLKKMYGLDDYFCELLTEERLVARYFDDAVSSYHNPTSIANWIATELFGRLNKEGADFISCPVSPQSLAALVKLIDTDVISGKIAKGIFDEMFSTGASPDSIVEEKGLRQIVDRDAIEKTVRAVLEASPTQIADYKAGKTKMLGYFVGQIMKETAGKANPGIVNELLKKLLA
jgi:aspartyl-tRNA(Asn)/glutamyl-tRNA(Gln) amidotransferase subunit B